MTEQKMCGCGNPIPKYEVACWECRVKAVIAKAEIVEPSTPLCIVGTDTFFDDMEDAADGYAGQWAHPCDEELLSIKPKRLAEDFCERAVEDMTEEAFEDAADHVKGVEELTAAFTVALEAFNAAQTASSWTPITGKAFQVPTANELLA